MEKGNLFILYPKNETFIDDFCSASDFIKMHQ